MLPSVATMTPSGRQTDKKTAGVGAGGGGRVHKTLDLEHSNVLSRLEEQRMRVLQLRRDMVGINATIKDVEAIDRRSRSDDDFNRLTRAYEARDIMTSDIEELETRGNEVGYYMRTADILFKYYDILEKGNNAPPSTPSSHSAPPPLHPTVAVESGTRSILKYFNNTSAPPPSTPAADNNPKKKPQRPHALANNNNDCSNNDRATLLDRYMQSVNDDGPTRHIVNPTAHAAVPLLAKGASNDACRHCGKGDLTVMLQEGYVFCKTCHTVEYILVDHEKPSYKDPPKEIAYFAYKRINHLNEWLNQVQGKETTEIPDDVFDSIMVEIKKQKLTNIAQLTRSKVKDILKKLRINKYYEHVPHIINRLNGMPSPHMPPELEDRLRHMFCMIQVPFLKFSPSSRKNFLSYSYCLHKMMQLLEKDQYLDSFPLLKSREKLHQQDQIWQKICEDIGWDFIPSL
jgi:hypothetical protein